MRALRVRSAVASVASLTVLVAAGPARAAENPPIAVLAPPDGSVVPASGVGLKVGFSCPKYVKEEEEGEAPVSGGADDYGVRFSTSPALGSDGRLTTAGFGEAGDGIAEANPDKVTCTGEIELPSAPVPAALYSGRIYWQASRECDSCASEFETGPVASFDVTPNVENPELQFGDHVYAGYLTRVTFSSPSELTGATVALQRWDGKAWGTIASQPASSRGETAFFVKLGSGQQALRAVLSAGSMVLPMPPAKKAVRKPGKRSVGRADAGGYLAAVKAERKSAPVGMRVSDYGTVLESLAAGVEATCPGPNAALDAHLRFEARLMHVVIAPDGTIVGRRKYPDGAVATLVGSLHDKRFSGELTMTWQTCSGSREFEAVRTKS